MKHQLRTTDPIHTRIYNSEFNEHFTWVWITIDVSKSTKNNIKFKFSFLLGTFKNVLVSHCSCEIFKRICNRFSKQIEIWYVYEDFEIIACIKDPIIDFFFCSVWQSAEYRYFSSIVHENYRKNSRKKGYLHHF